MGETSLNDIVYKLKEFVYDFTRYVYDHIYRKKIGLSVVGLIHILGFSTAYGMGLWVTFVSSLILGRCLSRQMFGVVQSRMFTVYYKAMTYCVSAALFGHLAGLKSAVLSDRTGLFQSACLASSLLMVLMNLMWLEPESTRVMYERMKNEKEEGKGVGVVVSTNDGIADGASSVDGGGGTTVVRSAPSVVVESQDVLRLNEKLKRLNLYTSTLNMLTLMVLTWHLVYLGQRLQE
ncbi:hypothetical protein QVD17_25124 [Tagetes erecta]|uniref:TMEM205-like domain-containing protein n=1 Tax=Tagetes erecta TaxID=13708 RepID=A0AAD8KFT2_TARER|nr:hypothetical protein QVD17_25124 [Tagetes erecta]